VFVLLQALSRIDESGTLEVVMANGGLHAELYSIQAAAYRRTLV
jgi:hypothetical protein